MKNNAKNAALTFAFTVAGACIGYAMKESMGLPYTVLIVGAIGAMAALFED